MVDMRTPVANTEAAAPTSGGWCQKGLTADLQPRGARAGGALAFAAALSWSFGLEPRRILEMPSSSVRMAPGGSAAGPCLCFGSPSRHLEHAETLTAGSGGAPLQRPPSPVASLAPLYEPTH